MAVEIVKMIFGAHLYGTATEGSDTDYKGVFLPSKREILLGRVPNCIGSTTKKETTSKNTNEDVDTEIYSLQHFLKLACEGQTVALDMLHAPEKLLIHKTDIWDALIAERERFYTSNLKAFIDYARKQAAKYGIKGSRLNAAKRVIDLLKNTDGSKKLAEIWDRLPEGAYLSFIDPNPSGIPQYQVCGKTLQATQRVDYTFRLIHNFYETYGQRAVQAARNEGVDWKAVSHAVRAAMQVKEILEAGTITFPLKDAKTVLAIKKGEMDYATEAAPLLESLMDEVEKLSAESTLPKKVDRDFWDDFLIRTIENHVL